MNWKIVKYSGLLFIENLFRPCLKCNCNQVPEVDYKAFQRLSPGFRLIAFIMRPSMLVPQAALEPDKAMGVLNETLL